MSVSIRDTGNYRRNIVKVPTDYNQTNPNYLRTWDERILDEDIVRIMRIIYKPKPRLNFASSKCATVGAHFSPPYSRVAKEEFGYGANES